MVADSTVLYVEEEAGEAEPKTEKKTIWDWELLNDNKPIWLRSPSEVSSEEYTAFYKSLEKVSLALFGQQHMCSSSLQRIWGITLCFCRLFRLLSQVFPTSWASPTPNQDV